VGRVVFAGSRQPGAGVIAEHVGVAHERLGGLRSMCASAGSKLRFPSFKATYVDYRKQMIVKPGQKPGLKDVDPAFKGPPRDT